MLQKTRATRDISLRNDHGLPKFVPCGPPTHSDAGLRNHGCRPSRSWGRKALEKHSIGRSIVRLLWGPVRACRGAMRVL
jgi:hypothetical protein